ncbi:unnamed protein product, partial [Prorocentrum cordatum]
DEISQHTSKVKAELAMVEAAWKSFERNCWNDFKKLSEVWAVLGWMCSYWLTGKWPSVRHDQIPFSRSPFRGDKLRSARAGQAMQVRGVLIDFRGDWAWYKQ